jgi:hypothetical protein
MGYRGNGFAFNGRGYAEPDAVREPEAVGSNDDLRARAATALARRCPRLTSVMQ